MIKIQPPRKMPKRHLIASQLFLLTTLTSFVSFGDLPTAGFRISSASAQTISQANIQRLGQELLQKIEAKSRKPLTDSQKKQISTAAQEAMNSLRIPQQKFTQKVSQATGVSNNQVQKLMGQNGQLNSFEIKTLIPQLETVMKRKLTTVELSQLRRADMERKQAMIPIRNRFAQRISQITRLSNQQSREILASLGR